jgi:glycine hydroxymethyltransferase
MSDDFIFRGPVAELDPELTQILAREEARQATTIILIASESEAPEAVSAALGSTSSAISMPRATRARRAANRPRPRSLDLDMELAHYRRYSDPRYYKGVENADIIEALARRRAAELFRRQRHQRRQSLRQRPAAERRAGQ